MFYFWSSGTSAGGAWVSLKIDGVRAAVCDRPRTFEVAVLAVGVGQGWGAVEVV